MVYMISSILQIQIEFFLVSGTTSRRCPSSVTGSQSSEPTLLARLGTSTWVGAWTNACTKQAISEFFICFSDLCLMHICTRCLSVAYSPIGRECRISRFDQRDSRILYDPDFDYYENLVGKRTTDYSTDILTMRSIPAILLTMHPRPAARAC